MAHTITVTFGARTATSVVKDGVDTQIVRLAGTGD
jgi:hypothetical protein